MCEQCIALGRYCSTIRERGYMRVAVCVKCSTINGAMPESDVGSKVYGTCFNCGFSGEGPLVDETVASGPLGFFNRQTKRQETPAFLVEVRKPKMRRGWLPPFGWKVVGWSDPVDQDKTAVDALVNEVIKNKP